MALHGLAFPAIGPADASGTIDPPLADAPAHAGWPDDQFHRLAALALLEELRGSLLSESSATVTLGRWCATHGLAGVMRTGEATITAERDRSRAQALDTSGRFLLRAGPDEPVGYRHVRLTCNGHVLSEADNWYVPSRLTPEMNRQLDTTDIPFGKVVHALAFTRTTLSSRLLWSPLPADWISAAGPAAAPGQTLHIPAALIENRAILRRTDGSPFSLVVETYQRGLLDFAAPPDR